MAAIVLGVLCPLVQGKSTGSGKPATEEDVAKANRKGPALMLRYELAEARWVHEVRQFDALHLSQARMIWQTLHEQYPAEFWHESTTDACRPQLELKLQLQKVGPWSVIRPILGAIA